MEANKDKQVFILMLLLQQLRRMLQSSVRPHLHSQPLPLRTWFFVRGFTTTLHYSELIIFHDHALIMKLIIITIALYTALTLIRNKHQMIHTRRTTDNNRAKNHPSTVLITTPSLRLLYLIDEIQNTALILESVGHQYV